MSLLLRNDGLAALITAITDCAEHSASSIAYLKAVLTGKPKKAAPAKMLIAQQYSQRDYSGADEEAQAQMEQMLDRMRAEKAGESA